MLKRGALILSLATLHVGTYAIAEAAPSARTQTLPLPENQAEQQINENTSADSCDSCAARKQHLLRKREERETKAHKPSG